MYIRKYNESLENKIDISSINNELKDSILDIEDRYNITSTINLYDTLSSEIYNLIFRTNINTLNIKDDINRILKILSLNNLEVIKYEVRYTKFVKLNGEKISDSATYDRYRDFKDYIIDGNKTLTYLGLVLQLK